jgi:tRNA threonylcarbamoyladenosine biosynthesis protein TsaB
MKILSVDTATEACSAALLVDGEVLERFRIAPRQHTRLILPMVDSLLDEAGVRLQDLDTLALGRGPGSFTGLRIAAGIVQGLALGADLPVVTVSSLAAMAHGYVGPSDISTVCTALDARMGEVYWGIYQKDSGGLVHPVGHEAVIAAEKVSVPLAPDVRCAGVGSGWYRYRELLTDCLGSRIRHVDADRYPSAASVAILGCNGYLNGEGCAPEDALPVYLRDKVARKKGE